MDHTRLGQALLGIGEQDRAAVHMDTAISLNWIDTYWYKTIMLLSLGEDEAAREVMAQAPLEDAEAFIGSTGLQIFSDRYSELITTGRQEGEAALLEMLPPGKLLYCIYLIEAFSSKPILNASPLCGTINLCENVQKKDGQ